MIMSHYPDDRETGTAIYVANQDGHLQLVLKVGLGAAASLGWYNVLAWAVDVPGRLMSEDDGNVSGDSEDDGDVGGDSKGDGD